MKRVKLTTIFWTLCIGVLLCVPAAAEDCQSMSESWFGVQRNSAEMLGLETVEAGSDVEDCLRQFSDRREQDFTGVTAGTRASDGRARALELASERSGLDILSADVTSFVLELTEVSGGYDALVYEWTFFDYDDLADGSGGRDTAGYGTLHTMELRYDDGGELNIVSDVYVEGETQREPEDDILAETKAYAFNNIYDPVKAAVYADQWICHEPLPEDVSKDNSYYNPAYPDYSSVGGDCANYVSQCLHAGGMSISGTWSVGSMNWCWCPGHYQYMSQFGPSVQDPTEKDIYPGSPIYYSSNDFRSYYHVTICVGTNSAGTPIINGHTTDRYHTPWNYSIDEPLRYMTVQMTPFQLTEMEVGADTLYAKNDVSVSLCASYQKDSGAASASLSRTKGIPVTAVFSYQGTRWYAVTDQNKDYYVKDQAELYLESESTARLTVPEAATDNDIIPVTVAMKGDDMSDAVLTMTDAAGKQYTYPMAKEGNAYAVSVDLAQIPAGTCTLYADVTCELGIIRTDAQHCAVTAVSSVSGSAGKDARWSLDKATGLLTISGGGAAAKGDWARFAHVLSNVIIERRITELPETLFDGCSPEIIWGPDPLGRQIAEYVGAEYREIGRFTDVPLNHWAFSLVNACVEKGIFKGVTEDTFCPEEAMTRCMFVTTLGRMSGIDPEEYANDQFEDVTAGEYYVGYVAWAAQNGIVRGVTETTFDPYTAVTREQAAAMIYRYLEYREEELPLLETPPAAFADMDSVNDYAVGPIEYMRKTGLMQGDPTGDFRPKASLRRSEAAALLLRLVEAIEQ